MATKNVKSPSALEMKNAAEEAASAVRDALDLAQWIEAARDTIEAVQVAASINPELNRHLKEHDIRYNSALWEPHHSSALFTLLSKARSQLNELERIAERALQPEDGKPAHLAAA